MLALYDATSRGAKGLTTPRQTVIKSTVPSFVPTAIKGKQPSGEVSPELLHSAVLAGERGGRSLVSLEKVDRSLVMGRAQFA